MTAFADALKNAEQARVAVAGIYIVDVLGRPVSELPVGQRALILDEIRMTAAGTGGGTAVDLVRLGAQVLAIGAIGSDHVGDFLLSMLGLEGVDTSGINRRTGVQTSATMLPIHPDGSRPAFHVPGANSTFAAQDLDWTAIEQCDVFHLGGVGALPRRDHAGIGQRGTCDRHIVAQPLEAVGIDREREMMIAQDKAVGHEIVRRVDEIEHLADGPIVRVLHLLLP